MGRFSHGSIGPALALTDEAVREIYDRVGATRLRNADGDPLILHHGTFFSFDRFEVTSDLGFHFGSRAAADHRRRHAPLPRRSQPGQWRVVAACLKVENPLIIEVDPQSWFPSSLAFVLDRCGHADIATEIRDSSAQWQREHDQKLSKALLDLEAQLVRDNPDWYRRVSARLARDGGSSSNADDLGYSPVALAARRKFPQAYADLHQRIGPASLAMRDAIRRRGYDSIFYRNAFEARRERGLSCCVFSDEQVVKVGENLAIDVLPRPRSPAARAALRPAPAAPVFTPVPPTARDPQDHLPGARLMRSFTARLKKAAGTGRPFEILDVSNVVTAALIRRDEHLYLLRMPEWEASLHRLVPGDEISIPLPGDLRWRIREDADDFVRRIKQVMDADKPAPPDSPAVTLSREHLALLADRGPIRLTVDGGLPCFYGEKQKHEIQNGYIQGGKARPVLGMLPVGWITKPPILPRHAIASANPLFVDQMKSSQILSILGLSSEQARSGAGSALDLRDAIRRAGYDAVVVRDKTSGLIERCWAVEQSIILPLPANMVSRVFHPPREWRLRLQADPQAPRPARTPVRATVSMSASP